jgi:O-antigen/teichoic acid export membrane protein
MSRVRFNVASNIAGQAWVTLLAIACIPFYIKLLGIEAFGLIALFTVFQNVMGILDLGLGATVTREVARLTSDSASSDRLQLARFVVALERWYWFLGTVLGFAVLLVAPTMLQWWLRPEAISAQELADSAVVFGLLVLLQWPTAFYLTALQGLQRQVVVNSIQIPFSGLSSIGGLIFVWLGPRSVAGLFTWQAAVLLIQLIVVYLFFWRVIGISRLMSAADLTVLRENWRFSLGVNGISITGLVLTYLDRLLLSKLLSLEAFGHYSLGGTLGRALYVVITPVFNAYFPRFCGLVSTGDKVAVRQSYQVATQLMAVLILPLTLLVALFSTEIAYLWLHDEKIAKAVAPIASLLVVGTCFNGLMNIPFALQLAHGKIKIALLMNSCLVLGLVPAIFFATIHYGAVGGATMWAVINGLNVAIGVPITHRFCLPGYTQDWLRKDVLPPLVASSVVIGVGRVFVPHGHAGFEAFFQLGAIYAAATVLAAASASQIRALALQLAAKLHAQA